MNATWFVVTAGHLITHPLVYILALDCSVNSRNLLKATKTERRDVTLRREGSSYFIEMQICGKVGSTPHLEPEIWRIHHPAECVRPGISLRYFSEEQILCLSQIEVANQAFTLRTTADPIMYRSVT